MSTDLYGVRILEVDEAQRRVRMRVFVVYYDTHYEHHQPIPGDRSFFVRVLCDKGALGEDIDDGSRFDEGHVDRNAFRYIERFTELERRNFPVEDYADYHDFYYERGGKWSDEDRLVQVVYDVFVTKGEYTRALRAGDAWGTTAYPTDADGLGAEDYPHVPDLSDAHRHFVPFPDATGEATTVDRLMFSADGARLLAADNEGGFRLFDLSDLSTVIAREGIGGDTQPGWTSDGRIAWVSAQGLRAVDPDTGEEAPFSPYGRQASLDGTRFLSFLSEESVAICDQDGEVIFTAARAEDMWGWAAFTPDGRRAVLMVEQPGRQAEASMLIDLTSGAHTPIDLGSLFEMALSPDGRYLLVGHHGSRVDVVRLSDQAVVRRLKYPQRRLPTAVAWSPDGAQVAVSTCGEMGYFGEITLHRTGQAIEAALRQPIPVPASAGEEDITDVARLYLARTRRFEPGWRSHLDSDLMDFHLAMVRMGRGLDLVPHIAAPREQVAARAYEAVLWHSRGEAERARAALADAEARLTGNEPEEHGLTFFYAPLAAAQQVLGHAEASARSWAQAKRRLEEGPNPFQKHAVLCRALLIVGRTEEVRQIVDAAAVSHLHWFHRRLLMELMHRGHWALLRHTLSAWKIEDQWSGRSDLRRTMAERGITSATVPGEVWSWLSAALEIKEEGAAPEEAPLPAADTLAGMAARGDWAAFYAELSRARPAQRGRLSEAGWRAALQRRDLHIVLDLLARVPCGDMNAPGLRALQETFRTLAGGAYRQNRA